MSFDPIAWVRPGMAELDPYVPGEQPKDDGWIKLNTNENPYPASPLVATAIQAAAEDLRTYPPPDARPVREAIAQLHGVDPSQAFVGNGSDEVLALLARVYTDANHPAAWANPAYSLYPVITAIAGSQLQPYPFGRDMALDPERFRGSEAQLLFFTCPNAPTGVGYPPEQLAALAEAFPGIVVIDEAYADFAETNAVTLIADHPNVVITRTLSKAYGLAGLRVGYAVADARVISLLDRVRDSYNVSRLAQVGAVAALQDQPYLQAITGKIVRIRDYYRAVLEGYGWFTYLSQANFLFTEPVDRDGQTGAEVARSLFDFLRSRKILVRMFPASPLTAPFLRISVGDEIQMEATLEAIDEWRK